MNKFKTAFALLAVLVILAAPAYAMPVTTGGDIAVSSAHGTFRHTVFAVRAESPGKFGENLYAELQT